MFLTTFFTTPVSLLRSSATGTNLSKSNSSTSVFRLAKFTFNAQLELSAYELFLISAFVA